MVVRKEQVTQAYLTAPVVDIYCRVSTDPQEDNTSLDEQEAACRKYCQENGLIVGMVHREVFSGYQYREREKLTLMRERYLSGKIQGVVVRTFDRLSRKEVHFGILLEEMEHHNIQIHCVKEVLEDSLIGRITRMFLGFMAEWEWEKIRERTTTGRINKAKQGKIVGGRKLPYGWQWQYSENGEKARVVHNNHQLWVIRWMAIKYDRGTSTLEIAKRLTERRIAPPEGQPGDQWHPIMIRRILSNERLTGNGRNFACHDPRAKSHLEPIDLPEGTYPPILSQALFDRLQIRLARNKDEATRRSERPEEFLLRAGFIRCALCGRKMHTRIDRSKRVARIVKHKEGHEDRLLYRCKKHDPIGNIVCSGQELPSKEIDAWVEEQLQLLANHTDLIRTAIDIVTGDTTLTANAKAIDLSLQTWEQRAKNYLEDLEDPILRGDSRASIRHSLNIANQHIEQLRSERSQVLLGMIDKERERQAYAEILAWCQRVREARGELTYQQKRDFLHMFGIVVVAKRDETGKVACQMEIELPQIKELVRSSGVIDVIEEQCSAIQYGSALIGWVDGCSCCVESSALL
jgi:site-specific DNA recombinase